MDEAARAVRSLGSRCVQIVEVIVGKNALVVCGKRIVFFDGSAGIGEAPGWLPLVAHVGNIY